MIARADDTEINMKITKIEKQKNNSERYNIYADGKFYTGMGKEELLSLRLKEGDIIEENVLLAGIKEDEFLRALNKSGQYIGGGRKTQKQVEDYLIKKGFDEEIISRVIQRLKEYRYIDDAEYARAYIQQNALKGGQAVKFALLRRGVDKQTIAEALDERNDDCELEGALRAGKAYIKGRSFKDMREARSKLFQALARRGFDYDIINAAAESLLKEE